MHLFGKKYLSTKEASRKYNYSESWFWLRRKNKLPPTCVKIGNKIYYEEEILDHWFKTLICEY